MAQSDSVALQAARTQALYMDSRDNQTAEDGRLAEYTPISARRGVRVHATSMEQPTRTACGRKFAGKRWIVYPGKLTCRECVLAVGLDARTKAKKQGKGKPGKRRRARARDRRSTIR